MAVFNCNCKSNCVAAALIASSIIGVITAFLQITGVIAVSTAFLWVTFGIAVVYLGVLLVASALTGRADRCENGYVVLNTVLIGILGTILFAVILLSVGIAAVSVVSAILVGLLLFFFALTLTSSACFVKCLSDFTRQAV